VEEASRAAGGANFKFHPKLDGSENSLYNVYIPMGLTAENVAERCNVSREAQDEWAVVSQNRAVDAQESGHFDKEIVPVDTPAASETDKEGNEVQVEAGTMTKDDGPRPGTTMEKLASLPPAFKEDGTVTAGNACPLNDGAAAVLVMSDEKAQALGGKPRARIVASSVAATRPEIRRRGPLPAVRAPL